MKPKAKIVISRYKEDFGWIKDYTDNYLVINKGDPIEDKHVVNHINIGGNQRDIFHFIVFNYDHLPKLVAFIQANPFDHIDKIHFNKLIYREEFTSLEWQGEQPHNNWEARTEDFQFLETNNNWYLQYCGDLKNPCKYISFDQFMNHYFTNYHHVDWIRFAPGSQYIVTKEQILHYPKSFWESLMHELDKFNPTEGHLIERALWMIFQCDLILKEV